MNVITLLYAFMAWGLGTGVNLYLYFLNAFCNSLIQYLIKVKLVAAF